MHSDHDAMIMAGLNLIQQALTIYDGDLRLAVCNRRFQEMFDLPDTLVTPGADFAATIRYLAWRGDYGGVGDVETFVAERVETARAFVPHHMERTRANGHTISVEGTPLPQGGWVTVYTDITPAKRQEALLRARSEDAVGSAHRLFRGARHGEPRASGDDHRAAGGQAPDHRGRGAHAADRKDDARPYRPCRARPALYLFQPSAHLGDAGLARRVHRGARGRGAGAGSRT